MTTASLELSKELYELSGWDRTDKSWWIEQWGNYDSEVARYAHKQEEDDSNCIHFPAYDLGYLLRKLPVSMPYETENHVRNKSLKLWKHDNGFTVGYSGFKELSADTPENAACKLAIELFKAGVLTKGKRKDTK